MRVVKKNLKRGSNMRSIWKRIEEHVHLEYYMKKEFSVDFTYGITFLIVWKGVIITYFMKYDVLHSIYEYLLTSMVYRGELTL